MNSKQYEKMMSDYYKSVLEANNIHDHVSICLSADRTTYEVTMKDGTVRIIPSGLDYFED